MHCAAWPAPGLCLDPARAALILCRRYPPQKKTNPLPLHPPPSVGHRPLPAHQGGDTGAGDSPRLGPLKALGEGGCREPVGGGGPGGVT